MIPRLAKEKGITIKSEWKPEIEALKGKYEIFDKFTRFKFENGLVIESSKAVIDLQIKKQIESMLQEFKEMEKTVGLFQ